MLKFWLVITENTTHTIYLPQNLSGKWYDCGAINHLNFVNYQTCWTEKGKFNVNWEKHNQRLLLVQEELKIPNNLIIRLIIWIVHGTFTKNTKDTMVQKIKKKYKDTKDTKNHRKCSVGKCCFDNSTKRNNHTYHPKFYHSIYQQ